LIECIDHFCFFRSKGIGANMMKAGAKRRRTHQEIEDEKLVKAQREQEIGAKLAQFAAMEAQI
jgi:hypothetical protein